MCFCYLGLPDHGHADQRIPDDRSDRFNGVFRPQGAAAVSVLLVGHCEHAWPGGYFSLAGSARGSGGCASGNSCDAVVVKYEFLLVAWRLICRACRISTANSYVVAVGRRAVLHNLAAGRSFSRSHRNDVGRFIEHFAIDLFHVPIKCLTNFLLDIIDKLADCSILLHTVSCLGVGRWSDTGGLESGLEAAGMAGNHARLACLSA